MSLRSPAGDENGGISLHRRRKFPKMYRARHSRMLLAGIQREFRAGPPTKAFGGDDLGAAVRYEPFAETLFIHASRPGPQFSKKHTKSTKFAKIFSNPSRPSCSGRRREQSVR